MVKYFCVRLRTHRSKGPCLTLTGGLTLYEAKKSASAAKRAI
jgi:hypothetical protein